jgi:alpha-L-rhamnosidase
MLSITDLRCEYAVNPLGIDADSPRLSWIPVSNQRGAKQKAYQVLAATSLERLERNDPDLWDSGQVESHAVVVEYGGRALTSGERCYWQVRVWDQNDLTSGYSQPAWFEMGLLRPQDWIADWIGYPGGWPGKALYFRRDFILEKPVSRARIYMAGLGWSELRVNGERVNDRVLDPPQTNYSKRILYSTDAVENFLRPGSNTIGVICANGWYGTVRLLLQMHITFEDGSTQKIFTETLYPQPWLVTSGPILENSIFDGECYDARLEEPDWDNPDVPLKNGLVAMCADHPGGRLEAASLEPIKVMDTLPVAQVNQPKPGIYVFDLGQNISGWARLRVQGQAGIRIRLRFSETLHPDGTINRENLRNARAEDVYILKGGGEEEWEPRFTYHGFRYIQMEGYPGVPGMDTIEGRVVRSAVEPAGTFECSNELYNRIHNMIRWTEADNLHGLPTDCPQRDERMGWLNDMAARTEEALYNFRLVRLLSKWTADIADEQDRLTGAITDTAPFRWGRRPADPVSVCYLLIPWLLYVHYGDVHTMRARYQGMKAWVDYLTSRTEDGIVQYSYYGDWAPPVAFGVQGSQGSSAVSRDTPGNLVSTACYAYSARLLSRIALALDFGTDAAFYHKMADEIAQRYHACFWNEEVGGYGTNNQSCNAISLYFDLVPHELIGRVTVNLVNNVVDLNNGHLTTGNICTKYLLEALTVTGHTHVAHHLAAQESYPGWGFMLANGATTLWERWELATGNGMNSHNHPMMGSIDSWFYRWVGGIQARPDGAGFEFFDIRPVLDGELTSAKTTLQTIRGLIECRWSRVEGEVDLYLRIPVGSQARVFLPAGGDSMLLEGDDLIWQNGNLSELCPGGFEFIDDHGTLTCTIGSGEYYFRLLQPVTV